MSDEEVKKMVKFLVYNAEQESGLLYPGPRRHIIGLMEVFDFLKDEIGVELKVLANYSDQFASQKEHGVVETDAV